MNEDYVTSNENNVFENHDLKDEENNEYFNSSKEDSIDQVDIRSVSQNDMSIQRLYWRTLRVLHQKADMMKSLFGEVKPKYSPVLVPEEAVEDSIFYGIQSA
ncbi:11129_t:CDS:2, partial [Funneliformis geosporum]